jgi:hypothetical protein
MQLVVTCSTVLLHSYVENSQVFFYYNFTSTNCIGLHENCKYHCEKLPLLKTAIKAVINTAPQHSASSTVVRSSSWHTAHIPCIAMDKLPVHQIQRHCRR